MRSKTVSFLLALSLSFPLPSAPLFSEPAETLAIETLAIPKSLGKIDDRFQGSGSRWVIQIQDVHAHLTAQENITALVDHLNAVYGLNTLALEGGWSKTSFEKSWGLPSSREKQMLAQGLLEEDFITGPAYAALFSQTPLSLIGLEEKKLYEENRAVYLKHLEGRAAALAKLDTLKKKLLAEKEALYNPDLKRFDAALMSFQEGKKADKFFPLLLSETGSKGVSFSDLPQMVLFKQAFDKEKALDKVKLQAEAKRLMEAYKRKRLSFEELLKSGIIPADQLAHYPAASAYLDLLQMQDQISFRVFFEELEETVARLKQKLWTSDEERSLDDRWNRFLTAQSLLSFEATPKVLAVFSALSKEITSDMASENLAEDLKTALDFYALAEKRDQVFFKSITENPALASQNIILVTGGFHTEGLSSLLRDAGISYVVITPELGDGTPNEKLYFKRLQDNVSQTQTLSEVQNRFFTPSFDAAFADGVLFLKTDKNIPAAVKHIADGFSVSGTALEAGPASAGAGDSRFSWETFKALPRDQQKEWLRAALKETFEKNLRLYLLAENSTLAILLKDPAAQKIWEVVQEDRNNTVVVSLENLADITSDLIGGKFKLEKLQGRSLSEVAATPKFKGRFQAALDQNLFAVILPDGAKAPDSRMLALKQHPVSLLYRLFLSKPELRDLVGQDDFLDLLQGLLEEIGGASQFFKSA